MVLVSVDTVTANNLRSSPFFSFYFFIKLKWLYADIGVWIAQYILSKTLWNGAPHRRIDE